MVDGANDDEGRAILEEDMEVEVKKEETGLGVVDEERAGLELAGEESAVRELAHRTRISQSKATNVH